MGLSAIRARPVTYRSATPKPKRVPERRLPHQKNQSKTRAEDPITETSRRWAEFRLAVVGYLVVGEVERGQLQAELTLIRK